jgi:O-antigen ligase
MGNTSPMAGSGIIGTDDELTPGTTRVQIARALAWSAILLSFIYSPSRTATSIEAGGLQIFDVVRGAGAILPLVVARLLVRPQRYVVGVVELAGSAFCLVALASSIWSIEPRATLLKALILCANFYAIFLLARLYGSVRATLDALACIVHALLVWVAIQAALFWDAAVYPEGEITRLGSAIPQIHPNPLGYLAVAGLLAAFFGVGPAFITRSPLLRVGLAGLYAAELLATRTRTALVLGAVVLLIALLLNLRKRFLLVTVLFLGGLVVATVALGYFGSDLREFLSRGQTTGELAGLTGRVDIWRAATDEISDNLVLGLGYYAGHRLALTGIWNYQVESDLDNTWLETFLDVGIVGTVPLAIFVIAGTLRLVRDREQSDVKLWGVTLALYGVAFSFVNPTLQASGMNFVLLGVPLVAALPMAGARRHPP